MHTQAVRRYAAICLAISLAACGGSGGGGEDDTDESDFVDSNLPVNLDASNAEAAAGLTVESAFGGLTIGQASGLILPADAGPGTMRPLLPRLLESQFKFLAELAGSGRAGNITLLGAPAPLVSCEDGGMVTASWTDGIDPGVLSAGDSAELSYTDCGFAGFVLNGTINIALDELTGDPPADPWSAQFRVSFASAQTNLRVTDGVDTLGVNGGATVTLDSQATGLTVDVVANSIIQFEDEEFFLTNLEPYTMTLVEGAGGTYEVSGRGTISTNYAGRVSFDVVETLMGSDFVNAFPDTGRVQISGAANSTVVLRVLSATDVELDVDADGDGNPEQTLQRTWQDLMLAADAL
jgi:hypothetical protein